MATAVLGWVGLLCFTATDLTPANEIQDWSDVPRPEKTKSAEIEPATSVGSEQAAFLLIR